MPTYISKVKTYSTAPYYDDYDESKNYHRVLFRPGFAVQARELTQLQTALQGQLDRHGQYSFNDGSRVVGGKVSINTEYDYVKVEEAFSTGGSSFTTSGYLSEFVGKVVTGATSGVTATVLEVVAAAGSDSNTLYVKYTGSGTNKTTATFAAGEIIQFSGGTARKTMVGGGSNIDGSNTASSITNPVGLGSQANIEEGSYFISGTFVYVAKQSILLDKYTNTPSYIIGLNVTESVITSGNDGTLVDNAQGVPNTAAPGANRYQIATALIKESLTAPNTTYSNYIILLKLETGIIQSEEVNKAGNTELTARMARRTAEESGDYSVRPFTLDIREHLDDAVGNNGYLTSGNGGVATKLAIGVEPSVAYVQGFRLENVATKYVAVDKPRDFTSETEAQQTLSVGNFVKLTASTVRGCPDINDYKTITLKNSGGASVGTARARGLEFDGTAYRLFLFDIVMTSGSFTAVTSVSQAFSSGTDFVGTLANAGIRFDSGNNGLVFKLPFDAIKSLQTSGADTLDYKVRQRFNGTTDSSGNFAFNISGGILDSNATVDVAIGTSATARVGSGTVAGNGTSSVIISGLANSTTVQAIVTVKKNNTGRKTKTKATVSTTYALSSDNATNGSALFLDKSDIIKLTSVVDASSVNVTHLFKLDNGQRDNYYDEGSISLIQAGSLGAQNLTVTFDHYTHSAGDYICVDSYPAGDYEAIPTFNGLNGLVELRDCLDFRPMKANAGSITTGSEFSTGTGASLSDSPNPGDFIEADITHYLARIDKLFLDREGNFGTVTGVAATDPSRPEDPENAMVIYELHYQPYVFNTKDLSPVKIDNKRYTMRDIGSIDKRVKNLEYYTSLNLLEKEAANTQVMDNTTERFKNGFLVDGFYGHNVGHVTHPDYEVAIDKANGILRPKYVESNVNLIRKAGEANGTGGKAQKTGSIVTLPYGHAEYIKQPYATESEFVNPYNVFSWAGKITLSPESDEWKDTETRPDVVIDDEGIYDQLVFQANQSNILGTVWNEWETNWSGTESTVLGTSTSVTRQRVNDRRGRIKKTTATTTVTASTVTSNQSRTGLTTTIVPDTQRKELGAKVVETNFIPFIRSRKIFFKAELMKPNTKVFAFFNGADVTNFCAEESFQQWSDTSGVLGYSGVASHPSNTDLITNASGVIEGSFIIPSTAALRFKTGTREFRLTDSSTNNKNDELTYAETLYHAQGLLEVKENTIISTKVPRFVTSETNSNRVISETTTRSTRSEKVEYVDPVAQTFLITQQGGIFTTKLDLFVAAEDASIPLNVSIRSVENGIPTQQVVPGTDVVVYPSAITTSADSSQATTVTFDHPVYLAQDQEYAIVLISQSDEFKVFIAETGGFDLQNTANRVTKQPYNGVFFTSANASTWTPEQTKDLKFTLYRANFTSTSATIDFVNDVIPARTLGINPFRYVSNSTNTIIKVSHPNHGMYGANNKVTIGGQSGTVNNITAAQMNTTHDITNVEHDSYAITISGVQATTVGIDGGGTTITATENKMYNSVFPSIQNLSVPGTGISYSLDAFGGKSIDGAESNVYGTTSEMQNLKLLANATNNFTRPLVVGSAINESTYMSSNKSFDLTATLTGNSYLSPVIDMNRTSIFTISNRTNSASNATPYNQSAYGSSYVADTSATGTSNLNSYITKRVDLNEEADVIDIYLSVNKPKDTLINLYFKVLAAGDDTDFDNDVAWTSAGTPSSGIIPVNNSGAFNEVKFSVDPAIGKFGSMAFKIVLTSTNSSNVPMVRDFRAIAAT